MAHDKHGPPDAGFSRRRFLKSMGVGAAASGLGAGAAVEEAAAADLSGVVGPGPVPITLTVNGTSYDLEVEPRVTLLDALRNRLDITGPKKVCDRGTCGACTALLDGKVVYACSVLALEAAGRTITTAEGLGTPAQLSAVQQAFVEMDAQQCGFCTPGFVVACTALLRRNPNPTDEQIDAALGGNLCRCGTYANMRMAVHNAAKALTGGGA